ncbi:hypothetical protein [Nocardia sp. NPDC058633]|uniref:hypothetical protein n=1 Tax=Nocardia sp. NPDC058633 TaxID=3346568 RepID=UPI00364EA623
MNHAEHDESIGSMLASIAAALREVSDKLDIVAARVQFDVPTFPVDEDLPDHTRIRQLESWAFHASQDISRLSSRLDALDHDGEPDSDRPARGTRSRREVREAAEAAERAADGLDDRQPTADPLPSHRNRDAEGSRPPLERRNSPARPTTDHLGDPTALAATPIPRTAPTEAAAPFGQPIAFDSDAFVAGGSGEPPTPGRRPAPARLSGAASTGNAAAAAGNGVSPSTASTNGSAAINGTARGVAGDTTAPRNGTPVPAVIGTVLTAPALDPRSEKSAPTTTNGASLSENRTPTSGHHGTDSDAVSASEAVASAALPGSADVSTVVRDGDVPIAGVNGFAPGTDAMRHVSRSPDEGRSVPPERGAEGLSTAGTGPDAGIERARPAKKPTEDAAAAGVGLGTPSPDVLSNNGVVRSDSAHDHPASGFTTNDRSLSVPNGQPLNGFDPHSPAFPARSDTSTNTTNGIHWSFSEDPAPPERNGHARNGFTTDSMQRAESLFDDFTPRERLTTGETPEPPTAPPARLTPPSGLTAQPNHAPADPTRLSGSSHVDGAAEFGDSPAPPRLPANTGELPDTNSRSVHAPLTHHTALTDHDHRADDFGGSGAPTMGLPTGRGLPTSTPDPLERPVSDPVPPTATDSAGITVTGTYRAFDIERAHVDKLQAMLDELKRSAGLPPGRRDVFGPPTPELG